MRTMALENQDEDSDEKYCYLSAQEFMDDGSNIDLNIKIDKDSVNTLFISNHKLT
jgi:hypothetical protein